MNVIGEGHDIPPKTRPERRILVREIGRESVDSSERIFVQK